MKHEQKMDICEKCPGTQWGQKSICRVHGKSIGEIALCQEWERHMPIDKNGQLLLFQLEPSLEVIQRVEQDLRDYRWMVERVAGFKEHFEYEKESRKNWRWDDIIAAATAQYGIEATLPKTQGVNSDITYRQAKELIRGWERMKRYEQKINKLENGVSKLRDEREREVAEGLMDGERIYMIAQQLDVTRQTVHEIKRSMIRNLAWMMYEEEMKESLSAQR